MLSSTDGRAVPPVEGFPSPPAYVIAGAPPPVYSLTGGPAPHLYDHAPSSAPPTYSTIDLQHAVMESLTPAATPSSPPADTKPASPNSSASPASPTFVQVKPVDEKTFKI